MGSVIRKLPAVLVMAACCLVAEEIGQPAPPCRVIVQWDNDLLTGTDRDYTNGVRAACLWEFGHDKPAHNFLQRALHALSGEPEEAMLRGWRFADAGERAPRFAWGVGLTQLMFTPEDHQALVAPAGERPYAGWLGLETSLHVKNSRSVSSATLSLGTTGRNSGGQEAQDWVHRNISNSPIFQGWDSQVPGELTINLHLDHKRRLQFLDRTDSWPLQLDGYSEWGAALGSLRTDAYVGAMLRVGRNLPATFSTPRVQLGSYGHELFSRETSDQSRLSLLGFAGVRGSAVAHDATLDGPVFRDFDAGVNSTPLVAELVYGLSLRYESLELSISRTIRSDEFDHQDENQSFGSVMLRFALPF